MGQINSSNGIFLNNESATSNYITISDNTGSQGDFYIGDYPIQQPDSSGNPLFPNNSPYWIQTYPSTSIGSITFNNQQEKYSVMDLPREGMPIKVFVAGRMLTQGMLGSDVEVAFTGDKLIFSPDVLTIITYNDRITISLEYKDEIYHYNLNSPVHLPDSATVDAILLSTIKK